MKRFRFAKANPHPGPERLGRRPFARGETRGRARGFSFVPPTEGQAETNRAGLADYNSFGVREFVFPRVGRDERLWLCEDRLTARRRP